MHILKIIHGYPPQFNAGSEVYSKTLSEQLSKNHKVSVFTREECSYRDDFSIRHIQRSANLQLYFVNNVSSKDGFRHEQMDIAFSELIEKIKPDVAHIGHLNHLSTGLVDKLRACNIPIAFTLHDFWLMCPRGQFLQRNFGSGQRYQLCDGQEDRKCAVSCYNACFTGIEECKESDVRYWTSWVHERMKETYSIAQKIDLFIAPSHYLRDRFIEQFNVPAEKILYMDYGVPIDYLRPVETKHNRQFTFGYIGTHIPAKGVNLLIEAFHKISDGAILKIWGRATHGTGELMKMAHDTGKEIEFMNEYSNEDISDKVFSEVDCIVVPSIWGENSPLVIHEAQACRIPVITADYGGMKEYVRHQYNGLLFEHRNPESLAAQMQYALDHAGEMKALGSRGYLYSDSCNVPGIEEHCERLTGIYQSLISKYATRQAVENYA